MSPESDWNLTLISGGASNASYPLTEQGVQVGRGDDCDIALNSQNVSRRHARIFVYQGQPYVQDLGSRNGVYVNGVRIQEQRLGSGDTLTMGEFVFQVTSASDPVVTGRRSSRSVLYLAVAGVVLCLLVAVLWKVTSGQKNAQVAVPRTPVAQSSDVQNMFATLDKSSRSARPPGAPQGVGQQGSTGAQEAPAGRAGDKRNAMVREYLDRAELLQEAGKLTEALKQYKLALKLDPTCALCLSRKERLEKEIQARINKNLEDGMKSFKALRYQEAINSWERVLNLDPDPGSQQHQLAKQYIADAEAKLAAQQRF